MATLIVPCAGKSTRFAGMKPKWMLTHPDGKFMVQKAIEGLPLHKFDRIIITVVKEHVQKYDADIFLEQLFDLKNNKKIEVLILDDFTSCQAETVYQTLVHKKVEGPFVVKDSDNHVKIADYPSADFIVGLDINTSDQEIRRLKSKSFLIVNEQGIVTDIIEKRIRSGIICLGVYGFETPAKFGEAYKALSSNHGTAGEIFLSHVISFLIGNNKSIYSYVPTEEFEDWGTAEDWRITQNRHATYLVDIDGILLENRGKYGKENWSNSLPPLEANIKVIKKLADEGAQIILVTSRTEEYLGGFKKLMEEQGVKVHAYVTGCNHAARILINDFASTNPYPSARAINVPRNAPLSDYLS